MSDDQIEDMKQFIDGRISQATSDLATKDDIKSLEQKVDDKIDKLDLKLSEKIDDLSESVAEALDVSNSETERQLKNHEKRITKLEHKAA